MDMSKESNVFDDFEDELRALIEDIKRLKEQNDELIRVNVKLQERIDELDVLLDELNKKLKNIQWMVKELEDGRKG